MNDFLGLVSPKQSIWRPHRSDVRIRVLSVCAVSIAFLCLVVACLLVTNLHNVRERWSQAGRATVYLKDDISEASIQDLQSALQSTPGVEKVRFVSNIEARREVVVDDSDKLLATLPPAAFPSSLEVRFSDSISPAEISAVQLKLRAVSSVDSVETYQQWTNRLSSLLAGGVTVSAMLAILVFAAVFSVIASTTRLLLHRRNAEVEVLQLVGATRAFIQKPFLQEGVAQGLLGALGAIVLLAIPYLLFKGRFDQEFFMFLGVAPSFLSIPWMMIIVLLGGVTGMLTTLITLRKMVRA